MTDTTRTPVAPPPSLPPRGELRRRVLAGEPTIGAFVNLASAASAELIARAGYDWVVIDLEHGMGSEAMLHAQLLAVQGTATCAVVRSASAERMRVGRVLDLGADGVMIPRLESVAEAADALRWMRYPPDGIRGVALITRGAGFGERGHADLAATVNPSILGVFQVESPEAVAAADEMAALDGVDVLFVGPTDLSHAMGMPGEITRPEFLAALDAVAAACRRHGKAAGILVRDASHVAEHLGRGYAFIGIGSDVGWVASTSRRELAAARAALG